MSREMSRLVIGSLLILIFSLSLRLANFEHEPTHDELYHVLAAATWSENGTFAIADGEYARAGIFTRLVGMVYGATDGNLNAIRILCIFIGALFVVAVFLGGRFLTGPSSGGLLAATIAATMLAIMPGAIYLSQFIRFYSLHALAFWLAAISIYALVTQPLSTAKRVVIALWTVAMLSLALSLQITTVVGLVGIGLWLFAISAPSVWRWYRRQPWPVSAGLVTALLLVIVICGYFLAGQIASLLQSYLSSSLANSNTNAVYYLVRFRNDFGLFWSLFPAAVVISLLVNRRPAFFCLCVFAMAFVLHSFAGMRADRYLFYAMPFFLMIWGIALGDISGRLHARIAAGVARMQPGARYERIAKVLPSGVLALLLAWLLVMTPATEHTVRMMLDKPAHVPRYWFNFTTSWDAAQNRIRELVDAADIFLTSQGHHAIYYIGDFDVEISATGLSDLGGRRRSSDIDPRTGRRVIADADSMLELVLCNASGVVVVDGKSWRTDIGVNDETANVIETYLHRVPLPVDWNMLIYQWSDAENARAAVPGASQKERPGCRN